MKFTWFHKAKSIFAVVLIISGVCNATSGRFMDLGETLASNTTYGSSTSSGSSITPPGHNWMSGLPDSTALKNVSLPGTHDSGALYGLEIPFAGPFIVTQYMPIQQQLGAGIRFLDIRTRTMKDGNLTIHHDKFYQRQTFGDVLKTVTDFLNANPKEVIVMSVKKDEHTAESGSDFDANWKGHMTTYGKYFPQNVAMDTTLANLRGKVVLLRNGFDATEGMSFSNPNFDKQDYYKVLGPLNTLLLNPDSISLDKKIEYVKTYMDRASTSSKWIFNYLSCTYGSPPSSLSASVNKAAFEHIGTYKKKLGTVIMDFPPKHLIDRIVDSNFGANGTGYLLQTGTGLPETMDLTTFAVADNGDLFAIKQINTGSKTTEVHVLSVASGYKKFITQTPTPLPETLQDHAFAIAPNRDLFMIKKSRTGSRSTEVHVLSAASGYQKYVTQTKTALPETGANYEFAVAANRDLFAIKKSGTGSKSTEIHVLSAASNYQSFVTQTGTPLQETGSDYRYTFKLAANRDVFVIQKYTTGSKTTEVHILSAAAGYKVFSMHTGTVLPETDDSWDFAVTPRRDLFAIKKRNTGSKSTEVHIVDLP